MVLIFLRSLVYNVLFYLLLVCWLIIAIPTFVMPRWAILRIASYWATSSIWLLGVICNTRVEYRGLEKIPQGPLIVASKHQSMWETFALLQFFEQPLFILKRELMWIPFFGWYLKKANMIGIDRDAGARSLKDMARRAAEAVRRGRQLIIFPEGTRRPVDAEPHYKSGIGMIYVDCGVTCLPVALNSGLFWPRRTFMRYPGTLVVEFLDPLPAGLLPQGIQHPHCHRHRRRHQPAGRGGPSRAGAIVRPGEEFSAGEGVAHFVSYRSVSSEFEQRFAKAHRHAAPLTRFALPKQPRAWIPGAVVPVEQPAPIGNVRQQNPDRLAQCARKMRDAGVNGYDEIELRYQSGRIRKISELLLEPEHIATRQRLRVTGANFLLQAHKGHVDVQEWQEIAQPHRPLAIPDMFRIARPRKPDPRGAFGPKQLLPMFQDLR